MQFAIDMTNKSKIMTTAEFCETIAMDTSPKQIENILGILPWHEIRDLMRDFHCSIDLLADKIWAYKHGTSKVKPIEENKNVKAKSNHQGGRSRFQFG